MDNEFAAISAQAHLHHQYFIGLQLMIATREGPEKVGDWMFRLFRRQHEAKFISSFEKLGLAGQPHAVACAKYHVLSNSIGGVAVEYMEESDQKAWVRFRYPRWMYDGAALCGIPIEASRGFLNGWYGQNGVSLGNPCLGFVCVSEDMSGQFGLCGYFKEFDAPLVPEERLQFAPDERPPPYDPAVQPAPPANEWSEERLAKANRNYAMEYVRNGLTELINVVGVQRTQELGSLAARLTGLQQYPNLARMLDAVDGSVVDAAAFLEAIMQGMGDEVALAEDFQDERRVLSVSAPRIARGMDGDARDVLLKCWLEMWHGTIRSHRELFNFTSSIQGEQFSIEICQ